MTPAERRAGKVEGGDEFLTARRLSQFGFCYVEHPPLVERLSRSSLMDQRSIAPTEQTRTGRRHHKRHRAVEMGANRLVRPWTDSLEYKRYLDDFPLHQLPQTSGLV